MNYFFSWPHISAVLIKLGFLSVILSACGGGDAPSDSWVSVRMSSTSPPQNKFFFDTFILPDMRSRGVEPREIICGVVQNRYTGPSGLGEPPDRIYHFRVSHGDAATLLASGRYIPRESYDETQPYTQIQCFEFRLIPRPGVGVS